MKKLLVAVSVLVAVAVGFLVFRGNDKPQTNEVQKDLYIAMGDSVAAGIGLFTASDSSACDRTNESYPNIVASKANYRLMSLACSGATIQNGILGSQNVNNLNLPAQIAQLNSAEKPKLITITIGANDIGWIEPIISCYTDSCGTEQQTTQITAKIEELKIELGTVLSRIKDTYTQDTPKTILTGYYQLFSVSDEVCKGYEGISSTERTWMNTMFEKLDSTIKQSTEDYSFAEYVAIDFSNHTLCSDDSWVKGAEDSAPFHPTEDGQKAIAEFVSKQL